MDVKAEAKKYYPKNWNDTRLKRLVAAGKLTQEEYKEITEKEYEPL